MNLKHNILNPRGDFISPVIQVGAEGEFENTGLFDLLWQYTIATARTDETELVDGSEADHTCEELDTALKKAGAVAGVEEALRAHRASIPDDYWELSSEEDERWTELDLAGEARVIREGVEAALAVGAVERFAVYDAPDDVTFIYVCEAGTLQRTHEAAPHLFPENFQP